MPLTPIRDQGVVYVCVDIEASGPVPGLYNMVSIAGVAVHQDGHRHRRGDSFYYELAPVCDGFDPGAMAIHGLTEEHLRAHGKDPDAVMAEIDAWVRARLAEGQRAVFVGHNAAFDWSFVSWHFVRARIDNPFRYDPLDTKALAMGRHAIPWGRSNKSALLALHPGLEAPEPDTEHHALVDAEFQADILITLLDGEPPTTTK